MNAVVETKPWWQSRTIWAQIVGAVVTLAGLFGLDLSAIQASVVTLVMSVVTIYLRFITVKPITAK